MYSQLLSMARTHNDQARLWRDAAYHCMSNGKYSQGSCVLVVYAVYVGDEILERALPLVYWGRRGNDLLGLTQWTFQAVLGDGWFCSLAMAFADVTFWTAVAGFLHRRKWYLKV